MCPFVFDSHVLFERWGQRTENGPSCGRRVVKKIDTTYLRHFASTLSPSHFRAWIRSTPEPNTRHYTSHETRRYSDATATLLGLRRFQAFFLLLKYLLRFDGGSTASAGSWRRAALPLLAFAALLPPEVPFLAAEAESVVRHFLHEG